MKQRTIGKLLHGFYFLGLLLSNGPSLSAGFSASSNKIIGPGFSLSKNSSRKGNFSFRHLHEEIKCRAPSSSRSFNNENYAKSHLILSLSQDDNEDVLNNIVEEDPFFDTENTLTIIASQSLLIIGAISAAIIFEAPNYGFGLEFILDSTSLQSGVLATIPLLVIAFALGLVEPAVPALSDVSKATQRSVIFLLGGTRKPLVALAASLALGAAAGWGEELLFRGVLQTEISSSFGDILALSLTALIFGVLHAVTPLYAALAGLASLYFGGLYVHFDNLAIPIICHSIYDVYALLTAHYTVTGMTEKERLELINWNGPGVVTTNK